MKIFLYIFLLILSLHIQSQEVQITASASPDVLRVGEQFSLTYTADQQLGEISVPDVREFELIGGPSQGHSQSVFSENGKINTTSTWQCTYIFRAVKEGKFTIPPATFKIKNKTYRSNAVNIEVLKGKSPSASENQADSDRPSAQPDNISDDDLYVSLILDRKEAYIGEQILATVKIYSKVNLYAIDRTFKGPDFTGFFTDPVEVPPLRSLQREAVNGEIYGTGILRRAVIIPQKTGELTIQPFELDVSIRREIRRQIADPFFDDFSIPDVQEIPIKLSSKAVRLTVKPLPPNAPPTFNGAVGNFRLTSSLNKTSTATNDPLTLKVAVSGKGNLKLINEVFVNVPYDMEKFDPVINTRFDNSLAGTKTFEYLIVPRIAGNYVLPPVEFTYFDPEAKRYKTLRTQSYSIGVIKGHGDTLIALTQGLAKEDIKLLNQDIRFIKTKTFHLHRKDSFLMHSPVYYLFYAALIIVFVLLLWNRNRIIKQNADLAVVRLRRADKYARRRLKSSAGLLTQGNSESFYVELLGALWGYLSDKLEIPVASLSKDAAGYALQEKGVEKELTDHLFSVIDTCEMARYAFDSGDIDRNKLYREALEAITRLQQKLK